MFKRAVGAVGLWLLANAALAAPAPNISNSVAVCDPYAPTRCERPAADGSQPLGIALVSRTTAPASNVTVPGIHTLIGFHMTVPAGGYALILDAATVPPDGAVQPVGCFVIPTPLAPAISSTLSMSNMPLVPKSTLGFSVVFSSTGCFAKTAVSSAFIAVMYQ